MRETASRLNYIAAAAGTASQAQPTSARIRSAILSSYESYRTTASNPSSVFNGSPSSFSSSSSCPASSVNERKIFLPDSLPLDCTCTPMRAPPLLAWLSGVAPFYHIHTLEKNEGIFEKFLRKGEELDAPLQEIFPSNVETSLSCSRRFETDKVRIEGNVTLLKGRVNGGSLEGSLRLSKCAVELINSLQHEIQDGQLSFRGKRVLELGCGHGLPGIFACLKGASVIHFQDLNAEVLRHVTIPNVRANLSFAQSRHKGSNDAGEATVKFSQLSEPDVHYYAGDWEHLDRMLSILRSDEETIISGFGYLTVDSTDDHMNALDGDLCLQTRGYQNGQLSGPRACERGDPSMNIKSGYDIILMSDTVYSSHSLHNLYNLVKKSLRPRNGVVYLSGKKQSSGTGGGTRQFKRIVDADGLLAGRLVAEFTDSTFSLKETWKFFYR